MVGGVFGLEVKNTMTVFVVPPEEASRWRCLSAVLLWSLSVSRLQVDHFKGACFPKRDRVICLWFVYFQTRID